MKKFFTLIALALAAVSANAQDVTFSGEGRWSDTDDVTVANGDGAKASDKIGRVYVNLSNAVELGGYQFKYYLPEGVTMQKAFTVADITADVAKGKEPTSRYPFEISTDYDDDGNEIEVKKNRWTVGQVETTDDGYYVSAYYQAGYPMEVGEGVVGYFQVQVADDFEGPATIQFKEAAASDVNATTLGEAQEFTVQLVKVSTEISTSIDRVDAQTLSGKEIYNLSGQRVSKPSQRGIYIVDGKKVMVK